MLLIYRLAEVGRLESVKENGKYETGQLFLHRIFGYRGVVLFPWTARVYDRDLHNPNKQKSAVATPTITPNLSANSSLKDTITTAKDTTTKPSEKLTSKPNSVAASFKSHLNDVVSTLNVASNTTQSSAATDSSKSSPSESSKANSADSGVNAKSSNVSTSTKSTGSQESSNTKEVKGKAHSFYQVLIDSRDCPYIVSLKQYFFQVHLIYVLNLSVPKRRLLRFWATKNRTVVCMPYPDWIMYLMMILCHILQWKKILFNTNYSTSSLRMYPIKNPLSMLKIL